MSGPAEHVATLRHLFEEIERGNLDVIDEVTADDIETDTRVTRTDRQATTQADIKALWRMLRSDFHNVEISIREVMAEGDRVMFVQELSGIHAGEHRGLPPTGERVSWETWGIAEFEDGQIVRTEVQSDTTGLFEQLGLSLSIEGYRTLIDTAPDPIVVANAETREIVEANGALAALLGRNRDAVAGEPLGSLHPATDRYVSFVDTLLERARDDRVAVDAMDDGGDVELRLPDGSRVPVELSAQVVDLAEFTALVVIYRDVSDRRRREQHLEVLSRVLRHNLRNDVNVIELLADDLAADLTGYRGERAARIREMARGLGDLARKSREIEGFLRAETALAEPVELATVANAAIEAVHESTGSDAVSVEAAVPAGLEAVTDPEAVTLALENLVENAVVHGSEPGDTVRVEGAADPDGISLAVVDEGPGIPDQELAALRSGGETPLEHGSGLGLWVAHWAARAVGGELSFETGADGTRATLSLPDRNA